MWTLLDIRVNPITCSSMKICVEIFVSSRWCLGVLHCTVLALRVSEIQSCHCLFASWGAALSSWRKLNATEWHTLSQESINFLHKFYLNIINIFNKVHWALCNELMTAADTELEFPWCKRRNIRSRFAG